MPHSEIPADIAAAIKLVILDVDGVLTDNGVYIGQTQAGEPVEMKRFHILDGLGMKMLKRAGMHVALVSGRVSNATTLRAAELDIECHQADAGHKIEGVRALMQKHGVDWKEIAWVGDDIPDLPAMRQVGLPIAVANAVQEVKDAALWQTTSNGGNGAVREAVEAILKARGQWDELVKKYIEERS